MPCCTTTQLPSPVHAHHGAEGLEPERMGETAQQFVPSVFVHDSFADHGPEPGHALAQPFRHTPAVEGEIGAAGTMRHQGPLATDTHDGAPAPNSGSVRSPPSKLDTVTPSSRTPLAGGNRVRIRSRRA